MIYSNKSVPGTCRKCGSQKLQYNGQNIEHGTVTFYVTCGECGLDGLEQFRLEPVYGENNYEIINPYKVAPAFFSVGNVDVTALRSYFPNPTAIGDVWELDEEDDLRGVELYGQWDIGVNIISPAADTELATAYDPMTGYFLVALSKFAVGCDRIPFSRYLSADTAGDVVGYCFPPNLLDTGYISKRHEAMNALGLGYRCGLKKPIFVNGGLASL